MGSFYNKSYLLTKLCKFMKRKILPLLAFMVISATTLAQTIVSTTPENKKVILEEFTGIHCVYCPEGHAIAQAIQNNNPRKFSL